MPIRTHFYIIIKKQYFLKPHESSGLLNRLENLNTSFHLREVCDKEAEISWGLMYKGCVRTKKWRTLFFTSTIRCIKSEMTVEMCSALRQLQGWRTHFSTAVDSLATLKGDVGKQL